MLGSPREDEMKFLMSHVNQETNVFEWGSGRSTIIFELEGANVVSVEHSPIWYNKLKDKLSNIDYRFVPSSNHFKDYINEINKDDKKYDIIFVDGRARVDCAFAAYNHLNGFLFLHDWKHAKDNINDKRDRYNRILKKYELVEVVYTMAKFKKK